MELNSAEKKLQKIILSRAQDFDRFGIKIKADVYFADSKTFTVRPCEDPSADVLCASITLRCREDDDEDNACGFDIILKFDKAMQIKDEEFKVETECFDEKITDFYTRISSANDVNEFIKEESTKEKEYYSAQIANYNKKIKRIKRTCFILLPLMFLAIIFTFFALSLS